METDPGKLRSLERDKSDPVEPERLAVLPPAPFDAGRPLVGPNDAMLIEGAPDFAGTRARGLSEEAVRRLVAAHTEGRPLGFPGSTRARLVAGLAFLRGSRTGARRRIAPVGALRFLPALAPGPIVETLRHAL